MLKHASPQRSTSSLAQPVSGALVTISPPSDVDGGVTSEPPSHPPPPASCDVHTRGSYSERSVDCESLIIPSCYALAEQQAGYKVGTWAGVSQANVRRGLSFSSRRASDSLSFRSVRSEGPPASTALSQKAPLAKSSVSCSSMVNVSNIKETKSLKDDLPDEKSEALHSLKNDMTNLKNLLRLPGIRGQAKIIEISKGGVVLSPDSLSLNSSDSFFTANSGRTSSRSWSSNASSNSNTTNTSTGSGSSTSEPASTTIKVFAKCLRSDIEYKTISVSARATCREVVALLLSKYRMRHRDPNLFYLTMEITVRRWSGAPVRSLLVLEEGARPAQLALCHPPGDSRFALQMRRGGVIKVHDTILMPGSQYKSLLVSDRTTAEEVVQLLLNCYNRKDNKYYYAMHEVRRSPDYNDRILLPDEKPLEVKAAWPRDRQAEFVFVLRRNMSQALSLRKLSIRTSEVKRPHISNSTKDEENVTVKDAPPTHTSLTKPPSSAPTHELENMVLEDALIDCTDVTPKMTTVSRRTAPITTTHTSQVFTGKISASTPPVIRPVCSQMSEVKATPVICTIDSSTNTEPKSCTSASTQTVISRDVRRVSPVSKNDQSKQPGQVEVIEVQKKEQPDYMNFITAEVHEVSKTQQQHCRIPTEENSQHSSQENPEYKMNTMDSGVKHTCKLNCQHCFYI